MKNLVITGGTKGIGKAVCELFATKGFNLAICARNGSELRALQERLTTENEGCEVIVHPTDVSKQMEVETFADKILAAWKHVDILVNNAGVFIPGKILEESPGAYEQMMATNLDSAYHLTRRIAPGMMERKSGHIFNMCSVASTKAYPGGGTYTTSKFALLGFSKSLREELKEHQVRVTSLMPGATFTASWEGVEIPEERFMPPEDIAQTVLDIYNLSGRTVVEDVVLRPLLGDI